MEIKKAKSSDLVEILFLLKVCISDMNEKGLKHWNSAFPGIDQIKKDLMEGNLYLAKDNGVCKGMVTLNDVEPDEYKAMKLDPTGVKPLFLQRLAVHPSWQGQGIAGKLVDFAQKMARDKGFTCIRTDIHQSCADAIELCKSLDFNKIGSFQSEYQRMPYLCYEKQF